MQNKQSSTEYAKPISHRNGSNQHFVSSARSMTSGRIQSARKSARTILGGDHHGPKGRHGICDFLKTHGDTIGRIKQLQALLEDPKVEPDTLVRVQWQKFKTSMLFESCVNGEHLFVRMLLERKADPEISYGPGDFTCLYNAALNGHASTVFLLCEHAKRTSSTNMLVALTADGISPLYAAAQNGHADCVQTLLEAMTGSADAVNLRLPDHLGGHTALHVASQGGHTRVVQLLLKEDQTDCEARTTGDHTPLMLALYMTQRAPSKRHLKCAMALIHAGASLHSVDSTGRSALDWAPLDWQDELHTFMLECSSGGGGGDETGLMQRLGVAHGSPRGMYKSPADELDAATRDRRHLRSGAKADTWMGRISEAFCECFMNVAQAPCAPCRKLGTSSSTRFVSPNQQRDKRGRG
jgi:hypothetical protein